MGFMLSLQVPAPKLMVWPKCPALVGTQLLPWVRRTVPEVTGSQRWGGGGAGSFSALQRLLFFSDFQKYFEVTRSFFPGSPSPLIVLMAIHCGSP